MSLRIRDTPARDRPRERLLSLGAEQLRDAELLAILLRTGTRSNPVQTLAEHLLATHDHSLSRLAAASPVDLRKVDGIGSDKAASLKAAFELARRLARETRGDAPILDTPDKVADLLREDLRSLEVETFHLVLVNTRRRLLAQERLAHGTLDTLLVHPREVFRRAIAGNAAAIILAHNHPSGVIPHPVLYRTDRASP